MRYSQGIPRTISVICDNALASAFALGKQPVDQEIIREIGGDFRLLRPNHRRAATGTPPAPAEPAARESASVQASRQGGDDDAEPEAEGGSRFPLCVRRGFGERQA